MIVVIVLEVVRDSKTLVASSDYIELNTYACCEISIFTYRMAKNVSSVCVSLFLHNVPSQ